MSYQGIEETKKNIISELKHFNQERGVPPKRRDIPHLGEKCYKYFGSFNKAKQEAGLPIVNVRVEKFPENAFDLDNDLAQIVSYVTFDGHLYKTLKGIMFSSKNIADLKAFEEVIKRKFNLPARYRLNSGGAKNNTHKVYFFNKKIAEFLFKQGVPKGDKAIQEFNVPEWISSSKEFSRNYLKIAYLCEGSMKENNRKNPRITFVQAKNIDILDSGLTFMNTLKNMLTQFDIESCECEIKKSERIRKKDNKVMKDLRFRIKTEDNHKFISEIGWLK